MFPDLSPLFYMAIFGFVVLMVAVIPGVGAGVAMLLWRVITTEWSLTAAIVGACVGLFPGIWFVADVVLLQLKRSSQKGGGE